MTNISPETEAVIDIIDKVWWDWGNMIPATAENIDELENYK